MQISRRIKRAVAVVAAACLLLSGIPLPFANTASAVYAAPSSGANPVKNTVEYADRVPVALVVDWSAARLTNVRAARAVWAERSANGSSATIEQSDYYNERATGGAPDAAPEYNNITKMRIAIGTTGNAVDFQPDILYQIKIELYEEENPSEDTEPLPRYMETVFLLRTDIYVSDVSGSETRGDAQGRREAGYKPTVEYGFDMPRVYVNGEGSPDAPYRPYEYGGEFKRIFDDIVGEFTDQPGYNAALAAIKRLDSQISELRFVLTFQRNYLASGDIEQEPAILIGPATDGTRRLSATVDFLDVKYTSAVGKVSTDDSDDLYRVYLSGRVDGDVAMPTNEVWIDPELRKDYIPANIADQFDTILRHRDIYPGSIYGFRSQLQCFRGVNQVYEYDFPITGDTRYDPVDTALRIIVSKISDEYVNVDVFRINNGRDYMVGNRYKVEAFPATDTTTPEREVIVNEFEDAPATVQAYVRVSNPIISYFYRAVYMRSNGEQSPKSESVEYVLQEAGENTPLMPKGVTVDSVEYDPDKKITNVTVSWDRPENWSSIASNDVYVEFELSTSYRNSEDGEYYNLVDGEGGGPYGRFAQIYRTALAVRRDEIKATTDRLSYRIPGGALYKAVTNPTSGNQALYTEAFWDERRVLGRAPGETQMYPDFLLANTRYYVTLRSAIWTPGDGGGFARTTSNASSAVAFTTYPTKYTVPLPFEFAITDNPVPVPPNFENSVSLRNSAVDWRYATEVYDPDIPVHYEIYISDDPDDKTPQLAGVTNWKADGTPYPSWNDAEWGAGMSLPADVNNPAAISAALITGRTVTTAGASHIVWEQLKYYGDKPLEPNKVYYFWVRTYIIEQDAGQNVLNGDSEFSVMISATTPPWPQGSDDEQKRLLAPVDLAIAPDADGNPRVTGESAVFEWSQTEADAIYEFVITSVRDVNGFFMPGGSGLLFGDPALAPGLDGLYESYIGEFTGGDGNAEDRRLLLDPDMIGLTAAEGGVEGFTRNPDTGKYNFAVNRWLFPNSLYYVSVRAVMRYEPGEQPETPPDPNHSTFYNVMNRTSVFVTVPLTTLLLDAPFDLRAIDGAELGFAFADTSVFPASDFHIYTRGPGQTEYQVAGGSQGTVVKADGYVYGRVTHLEFETDYDIRVTRGNQEPEVVYTAQAARTRDPHHSVEVEWKGTATEANEPALRFQVAVISETELAELPSEQVEYFELADVDLEPSKCIVDGLEYPYYISEDAVTSTLPAAMLYRAVILSKPTRLRDGSVAQRPLEANMRYYVKVRTRKISLEDPNVSAFSKFAGPVDARTDFEQGSQDEVEEQRRLEDNLINLLAEYERETFYIADAGDRAEGRFLLKEDKVVGLIGSSPSAGYLIDVGENLKRASADTIYIPGGVLLALQDYDKSLTIRVDGAEYTFSRNTIDLRYNDDYQDMAERAGTDAFLVRLRDGRAEFAGTSAPIGNEGITDIHRLEAAVIASNRSYANIQGLITDYIYNERTGLAGDKLTALEANTARYGDQAAGSAAEDAAASPYETEEAANRAKNEEEARLRAHDAYVEELVADIKNQVSYRIGDILEGRNGYRTLVADIVNVTEFGDPLGVTLSHERRRDGRISPFVSYDGAEWFTVSRHTAAAPAAISFDAAAPGYYSAVFTGVTAEDVAAGTDERAALVKVVSRYELNDVFPGITAEFRPELPVLNREAALLYERVLGLEGDTFGMNLSRKIAALGLEGIVRPGSQNAQMERQRAAPLLARMYAGLSGAPGGEVSGAGRRQIADAASIDADFRAAVDLCLEKGFLRLSAGKFEPARAVTRGEMIAALAAML